MHELLVILSPLSLIAVFFFPSLSQGSLQRLLKKCLIRHAILVYLNGSSDYSSEQKSVLSIENLPHPHAVTLFTQLDGLEELRRVRSRLIIFPERSPAI